ncbi:MAG: gfo/Idh/MocA family oxidoreductase [Crocinitomicaceae bacterium TMED114]|nr:MAG: gfo/Idh/MocA family oxidoreductase [Crocinitomicaceae bacterium TMED114]
MKTAPLRFAVVGLGHIGKRHAEMIRRHPGCELVAGCDIRSREELGVQEDLVFHQDMAEMLAAHVDIGVVCICTPNGLHAEQALLALEYGHHVIVEKPMALNRRDGEAVLHKALEVGKQVFCVMQNRYSPPSAWLKELVDSGRLGRIHMVQVNCFWNRDDRYYGKIPWKGTLDLDGGTLFTQFSHFVDILYWLFGDIHGIHARFADFTHGHNTDFEDSGLVTFDFVQGGLGTLQFSTAVSETNFESSLTIVAEKGTVKVGGQYMNEVEYCRVEGYEMPELPPSNPANDYGAYKGSAANHGYIFENVFETLRGSGRITTNALEGLKVVDIIERIYAAADRGLKPGTVGQPS